MSKSRDTLLNASNIAVVRTDRLGDMVLTLPMCATLRQECPGATITLITKPYVAPLLYQCPAINDVDYASTPQEVSQAIRRGNFDAIFFPRPQFSEYWSAFRAGIRLRVGSGYRWYSFLLNHKHYDHRKTADFHEAEYNTRLIAGALGKDVKTQLVQPTVSAESAKRILDLFSNHGITSGQAIIIHPGTGGSALDWPIEQFAQTAAKLQSSANNPIIITGISSEAALCRAIHEKCPQAVNLCGQLSLSEMIALLANSALLIANSTGVLHVAAALGVPVVGLYPQSAPMSAKRWGPYSANSIVLNPPSAETVNDDMSLISVESVIEAALMLLKKQELYSKMPQKSLE